VDTFAIVLGPDSEDDAGVQQLPPISFVSSCAVQESKFLARFIIFFLKKNNIIYIYIYPPISFVSSCAVQESQVPCQV
jgi:hypothetical protein